MAIKINLLPDYVKWQKYRLWAIAGSLVLVCVWFSALAVILQSRKLQLQTDNENVAVYEAKANEATTWETARTNAIGARAGYDTLFDVFVSNSKSGAERAALLNLISQYIYDNSMVTSIDVSDGTNVIIKATVATPDEYARFLRALRNATGVLFSNNPPPSVEGIKGFANGAAPFIPVAPEAGSQPTVVLYPISLTANAVLLNPVKLPTDPTLGAVATTPGATGPNGIPGSAPTAP